MAIAVGLACWRLAGCSSSEDDGGADATTSIDRPVPSDPSVPPTRRTAPPPLRRRPVDPDLAVDAPVLRRALRPLAQTIGLDEIRPIDSSSWIDERQRVVVDARREAQLLATAQKGAPVAIAVHLATMQAYAAFVATAVEAAANYAEASAAIGAYPDRAASTGGRGRARPGARQLPAG